MKWLFALCAFLAMSPANATTVYQGTVLGGEYINLDPLFDSRFQLPEGRSEVKIEINGSSLNDVLFAMVFNYYTSEDWSYVEDGTTYEGTFYYGDFLTISGCGAPPFCTSPSIKTTPGYTSYTSTFTKPNFAGGGCDFVEPSFGDKCYLLDFGFFFDGGVPDGGQADWKITISAVPEPATWLAMIVGFGAIGMAMRRRPVLG